MYLLFVISMCFCVGLTYASNATNAMDIVEEVSKCHKNHQLSKCFSDFWTDIRPLLYSGIPELDVPEFNSIFLDKIDFPEDSAIIQGKAFIANLTVAGLANYTIREVTPDLSKLTLTVVTSIPTLVANGNFFFDGTLVVLPVKNNGDVTIKFTDVNATIINSLERGVKKVKLTKTQVSFVANDISFNVVNILDGEVVAEAINKLINDHGQEVFDELKHQVNAKLGEVIANILRGLIDQLPSDIFQI